MASATEIQDLWTDVRIICEELEKDVNKNTEKHNISAGIRMRKGLRDIRKLCAALIKVTVEADKSVVKERKEAKKPG